jgi:hypothetical protein
MKTENENPAPEPTILEKIISPAPAAPGGNAANGDSGDSQKNALQSASERVNNRLNERKAGTPGRHKKDCACANCAAKRAGVVPATGGGSVKTGGNTVVKTVQSSLPPVEIYSETDRRLAKEAIKAVTQIMDTTAGAVLEFVAYRKGADKKTCEQVAELSKMPDGCRNGICDSGAVVAEKYGKLKMMPEATLLLFVGQWFSGMTKSVIEILRLPPLPPETAADEKKN